jgi:ubiquinone/menaquinone biosynthesis C-methylase UbiE
MPQAYERWLVPTVFQPFAVQLAQRISSREPHRVLELAAGTGVLTAQLRRSLPGAEIVATDLNASMVEFGAARVPDVSWRQADALNLPFDAHQFDVIACQFGVMFFPDKQAAYAEAQRVLVPGGAFLFSTWGTVAAHRFADALVTALDTVFQEDPPTFVAAVPHGYAEPEVVVKDISAAGFAAVHVETVSLEGNAESAEDIAVGFCTGTPLRAAIAARADLDSTVAAVADAMRAILGPGRVTGGMTAHYIEAIANP